jgi:hypothetical protein
MENAGLTGPVRGSTKSAGAGPVVHADASSATTIADETLNTSDETVI